MGVTRHSNSKAKSNFKLFQFQIQLRKCIWNVQYNLSADLIELKYNIQADSTAHLVGFGYNIQVDSTGINLIHYSS
ncbi:unnamed protein product [Rotaria magnacalcarata]|uniref:Uncharacterized protein n=1 Tax=Rotaria magnacalcarata TaxID=392030 RepID=A0A820HE05_9BILA|nr:unnamed protein product [Rotaria magnacalcarata]